MYMYIIYKYTCIYIYMYTGVPILLGGSFSLIEPASVTKATWVGPGPIEAMGPLLVRARTRANGATAWDPGPAYAAPWVMQPTHEASGIRPTLRHPTSYRMRVQWWDEDHERAPSQSRSIPDSRIVVRHWEKATLETESERHPGSEEFRFWRCL